MKLLLSIHLQKSIKHVNKFLTLDKFWESWIGDFSV